MNYQELNISRCYLAQTKRNRDKRGHFLKIFDRSFHTNTHLSVDVREIYYSMSEKNVLRGMHFQYPPKDHKKIVSCVQGKVLDAIVDLRLESPTYGKHQLIDMGTDSDCVEILILDTGIAHGFYALDDNCMLIYAVSSDYDPQYDCGLHWSSFDIPWPTNDPIVSDRDLNLKPFKDFKTPFLY